MKVTIRTSRVLEEHWHLVDAPADLTDDEILAIVRGEGPRGIQAKRDGIGEFDVDDPFVFSRGEPDLRSIGRKLAEARGAVRRAMAEAEAAGRRVLDNKQASERRVAADLGVDRNTVRSWIGKRLEAREDRSLLHKDG